MDILKVYSNKDKIIEAANSIGFALPSEEKI